MELYVFNDLLYLTDSIDNYTSYIVRTRYNEIGNFELHLSGDVKNIELVNRLEHGYIIYSKQEKQAGFVEYVEFDNDSGNSSIIIKGRLIESILDSRIHLGLLRMNNHIDVIIEKYLNDNLIEPENIDRGIPWLMIGNQPVLPKIQYQRSNQNLAEAITALAKTYDFGYELLFDIKSSSFVFNTYLGKDRRLKARDRIDPKDVLVFSDKFDNIMSSNYKKDTSDVITYVRCQGQGQGEDRATVEIGGGYATQRRELYVDARDLEDKGNYEEVLKQRANEKMSEFKVVDSFNGRINPGAKVNCNLGDKVTYIMGEWGLQVETYIAEIEVVYEAGGRYEYITFGDDLPNLIEKIRRG